MFSKMQPSFGPSTTCRHHNSASSRRIFLILCRTCSQKYPEDFSLFKIFYFSRGQVLNRIGGTRSATPPDPLPTDHFRFKSFDLFSFGLIKMNRNDVPSSPILFVEGMGPTPFTRVAIALYYALKLCELMASLMGSKEARTLSLSPT